MKTTSLKFLDATIITIIIVIIFLVLIMLSANIVSQYINYKNAIESAICNTHIINHSAIIAYSRSWDFAIVKTSSIFMSFLFILTGALYVLRVAESKFDFSTESKGFQAALSTSSPGLVIVLLGVILAIFSLNYSTKVEYETQKKETFAYKPESKMIRNLKTE